MYKKITDFAFGEKWGSLELMGFPIWWHHLLQRFGSRKNLRRSIAPPKRYQRKPAPLCQMNSRRVRPQKFLVIVFVSRIPNFLTRRDGFVLLVNVKEFVEVVCDETEILQCIVI